MLPDVCRTVHVTNRSQQYITQESSMAFWNELSAYKQAYLDVAVAKLQAPMNADTTVRRFFEQSGEPFLRGRDPKRP